MGSFVITLPANHPLAKGIKPPKADAATMPDEVPVLKAKDIHRGDWSNKTGTKHDLTGWRDHIFLGPDKHGSSPDDKILMKVTKALRKAIAAIDSSYDQKKESMADWSDRSAKSLVAQVWNDAMRAIGFDEQGKKKAAKKAAKKKGA